MIDAQAILTVLAVLLAFFAGIVALILAGVWILWERFFSPDE